MEIYRYCRCCFIKGFRQFLKSMADYGSEGAFYIRQSLIKKNNKIINRTFKKGTCFSYDYDPCGFYLEGKVIDCYNGFLDKKILVLAENNSPFLECNDCVCKPKFTCVSCFGKFCTKCLKKHPCGKDNVVLIEGWEV